VRRVEWRLGLAALDVTRLRSFVAAGLTSADPVTVDGREVVPRDVLAAVLSRQDGAPEDPHAIEYFRVIVNGTRRGTRASLRAEVRVAERPEWGVAGGSYVTGVPPSIAAQMLSRGERLRDGVAGPEAMLPVEPFFAELARRGLRGTLSMNGAEAAALE
jgi:saccharopine dehydrogenase-like NADP-dependent oxidoreductase